MMGETRISVRLSFSSNRATLDMGQMLVTLARQGTVPTR